MQTIVPECQYFDTLSEANWARFKEGILKNSNNHDINYWIAKQIEELGELSAAITKNKGFVNECEELGDVGTVLDLIRQLRKLPSLDECMKKKFNETSESKGSLIRVKM